MVCICIPNPNNVEIPSDASLWLQILPPASDSMGIFTHNHLAILWNPIVSNCTNFHILPYLGEDDEDAVMFSMAIENTLVGIDCDTTTGDITCICAECNQLESHTYVRDVLSHIRGKHAYIVGGSFSMTQHLFAYHVQQALRATILESAPLILKGADSDWPTPLALVDTKGIAQLKAQTYVSNATSERPSHCVQMTLTLEAAAQEQTPKLRDYTSACTDDIIALLANLASLKFSTYFVASEIEKRVRVVVEAHHWDVSILELLSTLADLMFFNKEGHIKPVNDLLKNMQACQASRDSVLQQSDRTVATEHWVLSDDMANDCFLHWCGEFLSRELSEEQWANKALRPSWASDGRLRLNRYQRSVVGAVLRIKVGHKRVAFTIWQRGLPYLCSPGKGEPTMMRASVVEAAQWLGVLGAAWHARECEVARSDSVLLPEANSTDVVAKRRNYALSYSKTKRECSQIDSAASAQRDPCPKKSRPPPWHRRMPWKV